MTKKKEKEKEITPETVADKVLNEGIGSVWMETGEPKLEILSEGEIRRRLAKIIVDGKHWIIVPSFEGIRSMMEFEEQFYWDEANVDFELIGLFNRGLHIALAAKSRCSAQQMADFINERMKAVGETASIVVNEETLTTRDVLFWAREQEGEVIGRLFYEWIQADINREQASRN